ncbi:MAG: hypothetical protein BRC22_01460, partial [Parcubacteria group bacterium QH_9_35_7]
MNKKTIIFSTIIFSLFFGSLLISPKQAKAAIDQRCFTKQECIDAHEDAENPESFFYPAEGNTDARKACGGERIYSANTGEKEPAGFCAPGSEAVTQVSFAGTKQFSNLGEFIRFLYQWSVSAGAILAVLVILVSGVQWAISMGKKEVIKKAKKRITKAIAGLALIASSYLILNTINPALVNMRLPQAWMIKAEEIRSVNCEDITPEKTRIAKAGEAGDNENWKEKSEISDDEWEKISKIKEENTETCGNSYYIEGGEQTCKGNNCSQDNMCATWKESPDCINADIAGIITGSQTSDFLQGAAGSGVQFLSDEGWESPWVGEIDLYHICGYGYWNVDIIQT